MAVTFLVTDFELGQAIRFLTPSIYNSYFGVFHYIPFHFLVTIKCPSKERIAVVFPAPVTPIKTIPFLLFIFS